MSKAACGFLVLFASVVFAQTSVLTSRMENLKMAATVAKSALLGFSNMIDNRNFKRFGFDNPNQIKQATLGYPIRRFGVRLMELRQYKSSTPGQKLLHDTHEILFPVEVQKETRSSLTIVGAGTNWEPAVFGGANYVRLISAARAKLAAKESQPLEAYIEVVILPLHVTFLGRESEGRLMLTPVISNPRYGLETGRPVNAEAAFTQLVPFAQKHKDLPS